MGAATAPCRFHDRRTGCGARRRFALALAASVLCHAALTAQPGAPSLRFPVAPPPGVLSARLDVTGPVAAAAELEPGPFEAAEQAVSRKDRNTRIVPVRADPAVPTALPGAAPREGAAPAASAPRASLDTHWYTAQDLDTYPRPAVPIRLATVAAEAAVSGQAHMLLWLRIDERGEVVEVSAGAPGTPGLWVEAARTVLTGVRFEPARKDERAVRSRILLSVTLPAEGGVDRPRQAGDQDRSQIPY